MSKINLAYPKAKFGAGSLGTLTTDDYNAIFEAIQEATKGIKTLEVELHKNTTKEAETESAIRYTGDQLVVDYGDLETFDGTHSSGDVVARGQLRSKGGIIQSDDTFNMDASHDTTVKLIYNKLTTGKIDNSDAEVKLGLFTEATKKDPTEPSYFDVVIDNGFVYNDAYATGTNLNAIGSDGSHAVGNSGYAIDLDTLTSTTIGTDNLVATAAGYHATENGVSLEPSGATKFINGSVDKLYESSGRIHATTGSSLLTIDGNMNEPIYETLGSQVYTESEIINQAGNNYTRSRTIKLNDDVLVTVAVDAFGTNSKCFRSLDRGASWTEISSGIVGPNDNVRLLALDENTILMLYVNLNTDVREVLRSTDQGVTWSNIFTDTYVSTALAFDADAYGNHVHMVYIPDTDNTVRVHVRSTDGGVTWSTPVQFTTTAGGSCAKVHVLSETEVIVISQTSTTNQLAVHRSQNSGSTWSSNTHSISGSLCESIQMGTKFAYITSDSTFTYVYCTTDYGVTSQQHHVAQSDARNAQFYNCGGLTLSENTGVMAVSAFHSNSNQLKISVFITTNGGEQWDFSQLATENFAGGQVSLVPMGLRQIGITFKTSFNPTVLVYHTMNLPDTTPIPTPLTDYYTSLHTMLVENDSKIGLIGTPTLNGNFFFYWTTDEGQNWSSSDLGFRHTAGSVNGRSSLIVVDDSNYKLYSRDESSDLVVAETSDGGQTWTKTTIAVRGNIETVSATHADANNHFVVIATGGAVEVLRSTNGGASWTAHTAVSGSQLSWASMDNIDANNLVISYVQSSSTRFSKSTDGGVTWSTPVIIFSNILSRSEILALDSLRYVIGGAGITHTADGGSTWQTVNSLSASMDSSSLVRDGDDTIHSAGYELMITEGLPLSPDLAFTIWNRPLYAVSNVRSQMVPGEAVYLQVRRVGSQLYLHKRMLNIAVTSINDGHSDVDSWVVGDNGLFVDVTTNVRQSVGTKNILSVYTSGATSYAGGADGTFYINTNGTWSLDTTIGTSNIIKIDGDGSTIAALSSSGEVFTYNSGWSLLKTFAGITDLAVYGGKIKLIKDDILFSITEDSVFTDVNGIFEMRYDGSTVEYYRDGVLIHTDTKAASNFNTFVAIVNNKSKVSQVIYEKTKK